MASTILFIGESVRSIKATSSSTESEGSIAALFDKGACLFDKMGSSMEHTPPGAGKTPTTPSRVADLAAVVDGGSGIQSIYSPSSQGQLISSIYVVMVLGKND